MERSLAASRHPAAVRAGPEPASRAGSSPGTSAAALAALAGSGVVAAIGRARRNQKGRREGERSSVVVLAATQSILDPLNEDDRKERRESDEAMQLESELGEIGTLTEGDLDSVMVIDDESQVAAARRGVQQVIYKLAPSRKYISYIAILNARRTWSPREGSDNAFRGSYETCIAVTTEIIRNLVIHCREFPHDFRARERLVSKVSLRRKLLDRLSWENIDSYLNIRKALKIRHLYRMEALVGRLPAYKYAIRDRKRAPGRKVAMRLKKTQKLMTRRLADQIKQAKPAEMISRTRKLLAGRRWFARPYDDANAFLAGRDSTDYVDPLNMP